MFLRAILPLLAAAACAVVAGCASAEGTTGDCAHFRFDSAAWKRDSQKLHDGSTDRQRLADGLARCHTLVGWTRAEVRRKLGRREINSTRRIWTYQTGPDRSGFHIDFEMFSVHFGRDGVVKFVQLWTA